MRATSAGPPPRLSKAPKNSAVTASISILDTV